MSQDDDVERVARAIYRQRNADVRFAVPYDKLEERGFVEELAMTRDLARAALSAMPQRLSHDLIAQLNKLASRLTAQGEYEACDLIDTVVARVTAMPQRELLREALDALTDALDNYGRLIDACGIRDENPHAISAAKARAAADKIRASLTQEPQT